jgi:hypothetical protein
MSEDELRLAETMTELAEALTTAHMRFVNERRRIDSASVVTAVSLFVAVIVDSLTCEEDDPTDEATVALIADVVTRMLEDRPHVRQLAARVIEAVLVETRQ